MKIAEGRMIRRRIALSNSFSKLSPKSAILFTMIIPQLNAHGKMQGDAGFVKAVVCPKLKYLTTRNIPRLLVEISRKTNVKYFKHDKMWWIHSINFNTKHQKLKIDRLGDDNLPSYPGLKQDFSGEVRDKSRVCLPEVEVEGKVEEEVEVEGNGVANTTPNPMRGELRGILSKATKPIPRSSKEVIAELKAHKVKAEAK